MWNIRFHGSGPGWKRGLLGATIGLNLSQQSQNEPTFLPVNWQPTVNFPCDKISTVTLTILTTLASTTGIHNSLHRYGRGHFCFAVSLKADAPSSDSTLCSLFRLVNTVTEFVIITDGGLQTVKPSTISSIAFTLSTSPFAALHLQLVHCSLYGWLTNKFTLHSPHYSLHLCMHSTYFLLSTTKLYLIYFLSRDFLATGQTFSVLDQIFNFIANKQWANKNHHRITTASLDLDYFD